MPKACEVKALQKLAPDCQKKKKMPEHDINVQKEVLAKIGTLNLQKKALSKFSALPNVDLKQPSGMRRALSQHECPLVSGETN